MCQKEFAGNAHDPGGGADLPSVGAGFHAQLVGHRAFVQEQRGHAPGSAAQSVSPDNRYGFHAEVVPRVARLQP